MIEQFRKLFGQLTLRQKLTIAVAAVAVSAGLFAFSRWQHEQDFRPLYTNLPPEDAGAIIERLKESGVEYRVSESGTTILVPSGRVAELRIQVAAAGLARSGRIGFELFDKPNFGATDFTEHVNYRRALEGEIERSIMSLSEVEQARVHITFPKDSVFQESRQPAKASVVLKLRPAAEIKPGNVMAISHLVASAVEGLAPEAVSILDMRGNLLSRPKKPGAIDGPEPSEAVIEFRQKIERDLLAKVDATLEPLLGPDRFRVGVSVDCDFSSAEQSQETFDPAQSVMVSSQKSEDVSNTGLSNGVPGTASNLPRPTSTPGAAVAGISRRTENVTYQSSRTVRHTKLPQGSIRRISVAVLLDQKARWEGSGANLKLTLEAPSPEKIKTIRDLVAGVTGFSAERGDQLTVESLPFESTLNLPKPEPPGAGADVAPWAKWLDQMLKDPWMLGIGAGAMLLLLLLLGGGVWFLLRKRKKAAAKVTATPGAPALPGAAADGAPALLTKEEVEKQIEARLAEQAAKAAAAELESLQQLAVPASTKKSELLAKHLREMVKKHPMDAVQVLRVWLSEEHN